MAWDERLAERVREALGRTQSVTERRMFGGVAFMVRGNMCCGVIEDRLMVRVGPEAYNRTVKLANVGPMDFTGKAMNGFVYVSAEGLKTARQLQTWVQRGLDFAQTLPAK